jgi:hypothetical protein
MTRFMCLHGQTIRLWYHNVCGFEDVEQFGLSSVIPTVFLKKIDE